MCTIIMPHAIVGHAENIHVHVHVHTVALACTYIPPLPTQTSGHAAPGILSDQIPHDKTLHPVCTSLSLQQPLHVLGSNRENSSN